MCASALAPDAPSIAFTAMSCTCCLASSACFWSASICAACRVIVSSSVFTCRLARRLGRQDRRLVGFRLHGLGEILRFLAQPQQFLLLLLQRGFALLPALFERLLPLLVLLLLQPLILFVFVQRLLALQVLLVFVLLDFPRARLLQIFFLLLALALAVAGFLLPRRPLRRDLGLQPLLFAGVILPHLVERRGGDIDLVQPLQFGALQVDGLAPRGKPLHLFRQLRGHVRQRLGNLQPQPGDPLHHAFHRVALDGMPDLGRAQPGGLLGFRIGRLASGLGFPPDSGEFLLYFGLGALGAHRRVG